MLKEAVVRGIIILFLLSFTGAIKENCNKKEDMLQICSVSLPVLSTTELSFALTKEELDHSCVGLRTGIRCIENYTKECMDPEELNVFTQGYSGITNVVQQLCTPGKYQNEYLRHAGCVKNVRPEYEKCSKKYEVTLTTLSNHQQNAQYDTDESASYNYEIYLRTVCCSFQEFLTCSENTVQLVCGDEAALFTSAFLKQMASNIIKGFCLEYRGKECAMTGASSETFYSKPILGFVVFVHTISHLFRHLSPA